MKTSVAQTKKSPVTTKGKNTVATATKSDSQLAADTGASGKSEKAPVEISNVVTNGAADTTNHVASNDVVVDPTIEGADGYTRIKLTEVLGLHVSPSRVRGIFIRENLNGEIDKKLGPVKLEISNLEKALKEFLTKKTFEQKTIEVNGKKKIVNEERDCTPEELRAATTLLNKYKIDKSKDGEEMIKHHDLTHKKNAYASIKVRCSNEASLVFSIVIEAAVRQLVIHGMDAALKAGKKMIYMRHIHEPGVEKLSLYPLIAPLPLFKQKKQHLESVAAKEKHDTEIAALLAAAEKNFKIKYGVTTPKKKKEKPEEVPEPESEPEHHAEDDQLGFDHYIGNICSDIKTNEKYKQTRISSDLRKYLSDLIIELIKRISGLVRITAENMSNKTVTDLAVIKTIESILVDCVEPVEEIILTKKQIPDPEAIRDELKKKTAAKEAGVEYQKTEIPLIDGYVACRVVTYPQSGFSEIKAIIDEKIEKYEALMKEKKEHGHANVLVDDEEHI